MNDIKKIQEILKQQKCGKINKEKLGNSHFYGHRISHNNKNLENLQERHQLVIEVNDAKKKSLT